MKKILGVFFMAKIGAQKTNNDVLLVSWMIIHPKLFSFELEINNTQAIKINKICIIT